MNTADIRNFFPFLQSGQIYLNHAATSPMSASVHDMLQGYIGSTYKGNIDAFMEIVKTFHETRDMASRFIGTTTDRIAFHQNTSEGLNLIASGYPWQRGDRVVLVEKEFPANVYPFLHLKRLGVEVDFAPQRNGAIDLNDIEQLLTPRTRMVSVSWVQYLSGFRIDLQALGELCRSKGIVLCVDAIQGLGALRMNAGDLPIDFLSAGVQKWQMGTHGLSVTYITEELQERLQQQYAGWFSVKEPFEFVDYNLEFQSAAARYEYGTLNTMGMYAYNGALKLFLEVGLDEVERRVLALADHAYELVRQSGYEILTPSDASQRAGIVTFKADDAEAVQSELANRNITVSARVGHVRMSPHFYNTEEEIALAVDAVNEIAKTRSS